MPFECHQPNPSGRCRTAIETLILQKLSLFPDTELAEKTLKLLIDPPREISTPAPASDQRKECWLIADLSIPDSDVEHERTAYLAYAPDGFGNDAEARWCRVFQIDKNFRLDFHFYYAMHDLMKDWVGDGIGSHPPEWQT